MGQSAEELSATWLKSLAEERRASAHTLRAYSDDLGRFIDFQKEHLGARVDAHALSKLTAADIRAFITDRRTRGLGPRGVQRALSAIRTFFRYLAREGVVDNPAPRAVRTPRIPRTLPRPLSEVDAARAIEDVGTNE